MSRTVKSLPKTKRTNARYPWSDWTNGQAWAVEPKEEFGVAPENFRCYLVLYARRKDLKIETRVDGKTVLFQFSKPTKKRKA